MKKIIVLIIVIIIVVAVAGLFVFLKIKKKKKADSELAEDLDDLLSDIDEEETSTESATGSPAVAIMQKTA